MRLSIFRENDKVLLVGEGNFSFSVSLIKHNLPIAITASCYETLVSNETSKKNLEFLEANGIRVVLGVDGTKLEDSKLVAEKFDKIIFNFPHVGGKMRLDKNRELLKGFFVSAEKILENDGVILMTLCNGQGGTYADNPKRRWDDSWKVTEMAAHGNFILNSIEPFVEKNFCDYFSTGYRGLDKEFRIQKSLTHVFRKAEPPSYKNIAPKEKIDQSKINDRVNYRDILSYRSKSLDLLCPPVFVFDITFTIQPEFRVTDLYSILHDFAGLIIRDIEFVRSYKFPDEERITETYRISYQSDEFPLYRERIVDIHRNIISKLLEENLRVIVTR